MMLCRLCVASSLATILLATVVEGVDPNKIFRDDTSTDESRNLGREKASGPPLNRPRHPNFKRGETPSPPFLVVAWGDYPESKGKKKGKSRQWLAVNGLTLTATLENISVDQTLELLDVALHFVDTGPYVIDRRRRDDRADLTQEDEDRDGQPQDGNENNPEPLKISVRDLPDRLRPGKKVTVAFSVADFPFRRLNTAMEVLVIAKFAAGGSASVKHSFPPVGLFLTFDDLNRVQISSEQRAIRLPNAERSMEGIWKAAADMIGDRSSFASKQVLTEDRTVQPVQSTFVIPYRGREERNSPWWYNNPPVEGGGDMYNHPYMACGNWKAVYLDSNGGEDYLSKPFLAYYPSKFARASLTQGGPNVQQPILIWDGYLDEVGCTPPFLLEPMGDYALYIEPILRTPSGTTIEIRYDASSTEGYITFFQPGFPSILQTTFVKVKPDAHTNLTQAAAVLSQGLATEDIGLDGGDYILVYADQACTPTISACFGWNRLNLGPRPNGIHTTSYKYVVAHEFGHAVQDRAGASTPGQGYDDFYDEETAEPECRCDHVFSANQLHCLQSREALGDAIAEGWGQFFGAKIFNDPTDDDCIFAYYKEFLENQMVEGVPNWHDCLQPITWMESKCDLSRRGTEYDWMQFLYFINTQLDPKVTIADLAVIFTNAGTAPLPPGEPDPNGIYWEDINESAKTYFGEQSPELDAWVNAAETYGVDAL